jgi:hypothetical protein
MRLRESLLFVACICVVTSTGVFADTSPAPLVICGAGVRPTVCRFAEMAVTDAVSRLRVVPEDWRWVIVSKTRWPMIATALKTDSAVPAFSNPTLRTTYLHEDLFIARKWIDEYFRIPIDRTIAGRLEWIVAHEAGHVLCDTGDEHRADWAARHLLYARGGTALVCK